MVRFTTASISDGTLQVRGPADGDPGMEVKHLRFTIAQGVAMVEDEANVSGGEWAGTTSAGGLQPGPARRDRPGGPFQRRLAGQLRDAHLGGADHRDLAR